MGEGAGLCVSSTQNPAPGGEPKGEAQGSCGSRNLAFPGVAERCCCCDRCTGFKDQTQSNLLTQKNIHVRLNVP